jgi:hypothetical protein
VTPAFPDTELIERLRMAALVDSAIGRYYDHDLLMATVARMTTLEKSLEQAHNALRQARPDLAMWNMDTSYIDDALAGVDVPDIVQCPNCFLMIDSRLSVQQATAPTVAAEMSDVQAVAFPYQRTFDAIAAATSVCGGHIAVSVEKFVASFNATSASPDPMTKERIQKVAETLGEAIAGESDYESWGHGYRQDENGKYTIPVVPEIAFVFARALLEACETNKASEDTKRLDFYEENLESDRAHDGTVSVWLEKGHGEELTGKTMREAIDAARRYAAPSEVQS